MTVHLSPWRQEEDNESKSKTAVKQTKAGVCVCVCVYSCLQAFGDTFQSDALTSESVHLGVLT